MRLRCLFPLVPVLATALLPASDAHADDPEADRGHLTIDPVADGAVIATGAGFSVLLGLVLSTGEIQPLKAGSADALLGIDRIAVTQKIDPNAGLYSNIGLYAAVGFAALDSLSSGLLQHRWNATLVDSLMYSESLSLALAFDDIVKIAVRRPRPIDYLPENANNTTNTDLALSFFWHSAVVAAMSGTATYLAFLHSPRSPRPWITLAAGTLLTAFVSYERVRAGAHFPTPDPGADPARLSASARRPRSIAGPRARARVARPGPIPGRRTLAPKRSRAPPQRLVRISRTEFRLVQHRPALAYLRRFAKGHSDSSRREFPGIQHFLKGRSPVAPTSVDSGSP